MTTRQSNGNDFDSEMSKSIKSLFELTTRIDEKVKLLCELSSKVDLNYNLLMETKIELLQRITYLESKNGSELKKQLEDLNNKFRTVEMQVQATEIISKGHHNRLGKIADNGMKLLIAVAAAFIIWKSGWSGNELHVTNTSPTSAVTSP